MNVALSQRLDTAIIFEKEEENIVTVPQTIERIDELLPKETSVTEKIIV
jgi:hypothetical protein